MSRIEEMEGEIKELDEFSEYLASKRLWAENKLKTEKLEIGKELTVELQVAKTKKRSRRRGRESKRN